MGSKYTSDLSPGIFRAISVVSAITIIIHLTLDALYTARIDYGAVVPSIMLFILSESARAKIIDKKRG